MVILIGIVSILLAVFLLVGLTNEASNKEAKKRISEEKRKKRAEEQAARDIELESKYGKLTKAIEYEGITKHGSIRVYNESHIILLNYEPYRFDEILNFTFSDKNTITGGTFTANTQTSSSSMLGRSAIGAIVAGPAGAIIGGSTAKKNTIIKQGPKINYHSYTINITVNRIEKPLVSLCFGDNDNIANEAIAILNIIINSNKMVHM